MTSCLGACVAYPSRVLGPSLDAVPALLIHFAAPLQQHPEPYGIRSTSRRTLRPERFRYLPFTLLIAHGGRHTKKNHAQGVRHRSHLSRQG